MTTAEEDPGFDALVKKRRALLHAAMQYVAAEYYALDHTDDATVLAQLELAEDQLDETVLEYFSALIRDLPPKDTTDAGQRQP